VIELEQDQIELLTQPIPAMESDPNDRKQQAENMAEFLSGMAEAVGIPTEHAVATGNTVAVERAKKVLANDKLRGMKLLPKEIREQLPPLYAQDGKGGKAIVYVKYFTPDSQWTWHCTYAELGISAVMWSSGLCRVESLGSCKHVWFAALHTIHTFSTRHNSVFKFGFQRGVSRTK